MQQKRIKGPWKSGLHLLVAIDYRQQSTKLLRWAKNLSYSMGANIQAVYVETLHKLNPKEREQLHKNINLTSQLGIKFRIITNYDLVKGLVDFAQKENVTHIIIGKPRVRNAMAPLFTPAADTYLRVSFATALAVPVLPADAQERMYAEQLASQYSIKSLAQGDIASFKLGTPAVQGDTADVPLTAIWKSGARRSGVMTFRSYQGLWYFYQLSVASDQDEKTPEATSIDPDVVRVYTEQQATPANQELISHGIIGGGQSVAEVKGVTTGSGTATVNLAMSGGSEAPAAGKIVLLKKKEGSETYWFIARFEKR